MDIVERINVRCLPYGALALLDEAAEEIRRVRIKCNEWIARASEMEAQRDRLQAELKAAHDAWYGRCRVIEERDDEIGRLQAENERLRWRDEARAAFAPTAHPRVD
jgi:hypothetical protein